VDELRELRAVLTEGHNNLSLPQSSDRLRQQIVDRLAEPIQTDRPAKGQSHDHVEAGDVLRDSSPRHGFRIGSEPKRGWWDRRYGISPAFACVTAVCLLLVLLPTLAFVQRKRTERQAVAVTDGAIRTYIAQDTDKPSGSGAVEISMLRDGSTNSVAIGESVMPKTSPHFGGYREADVPISSLGYVSGREGSQEHSQPSGGSPVTPSEVDTHDYRPMLSTRGLGAAGGDMGGMGGGMGMDMGGETGGSTRRGRAMLGWSEKLAQQPATRPASASTTGLGRVAGRTRWHRSDGQSTPMEPGGADRHRMFDSSRVPATALSAVGNEQYESLAENSFLEVNEQPVSTFSIDVDTASYANVRRFLTQGQLPPPAAVRIEEMINYFSYNDRAPQGREPFAVTMEVAECPWTPGHQLLRIALKGESVPQLERPPCNLVFLLDVSGSMSPPNKLPLLQQAMKLLTDQLTEKDRVAIVTYAGDAGLRLDSISGDQHQEIRRTIDSLQSGGSTHGSAGIQLAYQQAEQYFLEEGVNRVILATDGDLNVGVTHDDALVELIKSKAKSGVFLTVLGFGEGNLKDAKLEKLADNGNGAYAYIDNLREGRRVLVEQVAGSLVTIAKDVKIRVEFNPGQVHAYRLIGYENRLMTPPEFDDDRKDAGEIGAGHSVTALYEIALSDAPWTVARLAQDLKYQQSPEPVPPPLEWTRAAHSGELLTLSLRYKRPDSAKSTLREFALQESRKPFSTASQDFRFSSAVAAFGMLLRGSQFRGNASFAAVEETASAALGSDPGGYRTELLDLVRRADQLSH